MVVALGTTASAFWILALNSWMHTPAGFEMINGQAHVTSWFEVIFNPSFPYRLAHMVLAAFITTCFVIGGVSAGYLRRGVHREAGVRMLKLAVAFAAITVPLQVLVGDLHGLSVGEHQPTKLAAMEAHWEAGAPGEGVPLVLFAVPNATAERNDYEIAIPRLGSLILTHSLDGEIQPLKAVPPSERPPVAPVFFGFRVMVGLGVLMIFIAVAGLWLRWRGTLYQSRWFLRLCSVMAPSGVIAVLAGWYVVEVGRQPWLVQGLVRTMDVVSPLPAERVALSLSLFVLTYSLLFGVYLYFMRKLIRKGPPPLEQLHQQLIGVKASGYAVALAKQLTPAQEQK